MVNKSKFRT